MNTYSVPFVDTASSSRIINNTVPQSARVFIAVCDFESENEENLSFKKSERFQITNTPDGDWWYARSLKTNEKGYVRCSHVAPANNYEDEEWFHGDITRAEAERRLMATGLPCGAFLLRNSESEPGNVSLSFRYGESIKHCLIRKLGAGVYYITNTIRFTSIQHLVESYRRNAYGLSCTLSEPCPKNKSQPDWEIPREALKVIKLLHSGEHGQVWSGFMNNSTPIAVKTFRTGTVSPDRFLDEAAVMRILRHKHIVQVYAICSDGEPIYTMELMSKGSLLHFLWHGDGANLKLHALIDMMTQVASGMAYVEKMKYIHRKLAARSILVTENYLCKVASFRLARFVGGGDNNTYTGEKDNKILVKWTAPESVLCNNFTIKSDVWSFGILMTEIITKGRKPYPEMNNRETVEQIQSGYRMPIPPNCPEPLYEVMLRCWDEDACKRPTFDYLAVFFGSDILDIYRSEEVD